MCKEDKIKKLKEYCSSTRCDNCLLKNDDWTKPVSVENCPDFFLSPEEELDKALTIINVGKNPIPPIPNVARQEVGLNPIKPDYYNDTKIAPIDVIEDWDLDFCLGSALKYIKRCGKKENNPSVQDLKKVIWYIERRIKELEEATNG